MRGTPRKAKQSMSHRGLAMAKQLEEDLRLLSVEARKRYPLVKEAAERSIIKLRAKIAVLLRVARSEGSNGGVGGGGDGAGGGGEGSGNVGDGGGAVGEGGGGGAQ